MLKQQDIQMQLYRAMLAVGAVLSVVSIIGNCFTSFPLLQSLKWLVLFLVAATAYAFSGNAKYNEHIKFGVFVFCIFLFLPFAYMGSGGSDNNAIGYIFLLLIAIAYLFSGGKRIFLVVSLVVMFMVLHALEYYCPKLVSVYPKWNQFVDRMIQIPLLMTASFLIVLQFAKEYEKVNARLGVYANCDELTGLYNRRVFNRAMEEAVKKGEDDVHLAFLDVDNFKKINDQYGHAVGDEVLRGLSALLRQTFGSDRHIVSRWGGDEFAVIYYGDKEELTGKLRQVKEAFGMRAAVYKVAAGISTSLVSFSDYEKDKAHQVLEDADHRLYREKQKNL